MYNFLPSPFPITDQLFLKQLGDHHFPITQPKMKQFLEAEKGSEELRVSAPSAGRVLVKGSIRKILQICFERVCFSFMQICHTFKLTLSVVEHD